MSEWNFDAILRPIFAGRRAVLALGPAATMESWVAALRRLGVERFLLLADGVGTGAVPEADDVELISVGGSDPDMMTALRLYERTVGDPPAEVRRAIDVFDPDGSALAMVSHVSDVAELHGRPCFGRRLPEWAALEDKTTCDALWDLAGVPRAPSRVVPSQREPLVVASREVDAGNGVVWSGDNREGFHGGATYVRWIRRAADVDEACQFFAARCDRVRVMPFLDGIPCSMHGLVGADELMVLRPVEMVVFRRPGLSTLLYAGAATNWDPPRRCLREMRERVRRVGQTLAVHHRYRGGYTVDGVMTEDGFLPTELNARAGAGLGAVAGGITEVPVKVIEKVLRHGLDLAVDLRRLERYLVAAAERQRSAGAWTTLGRTIAATSQYRIGWDPGRECYLPCESIGSGGGDATLIIGPSPTGGFIRFGPDPGSLPIGRAVAPRAAAAFALADRIAGTGLGTLEPAPDVHRLKEPRRAAAWRPR